jgi:rod shape-determining protein MreC
MTFLARYGNFFLFLILESIALFMVAQYNKKQNEVYQSSANLFTGIIYDNLSTVRNYFLIKNINDSLARENADLRTQLEASKYVATQQRGEVTFPLDTSTIRPDTAQKKDVIQKFKYITAEVINNSISRTENYLTINRGSEHGVKAGMGVIATNGIVGIVRNVSPRYAQVMSVLNEKISISAMIKRSRFFGSLRWHSKTRNPRLLTLESIPKHAEVLRGDTIITGFSEIFPGEIKIGRVTDFRVENGSNFYTIDVETWNDMSNVQYVYVVENLMLEELKSLYKEPQPTGKQKGKRVAPQEEINSF